MRKTNLARLLVRRPDGIFVAPFEQGEIGPDLFRAACAMGLEGLVSKRRGRPYQSGRSKHWVKIKNRKHPAMSRVVGIAHRCARLVVLARERHLCEAHRRGRGFACVIPDSGREST